MRAMELHQRALNRLTLALIAVALLTVGAIGIAVLVDANGDQLETTSRSARILAVEQAADTRTFEQNTELPTGGEIDTAAASKDAGARTREKTQSATESFYLEQNTWLSGDSRQPNDSNSALVDR